LFSPIAEFPLSRGEGARGRGGGGKIVINLTELKSLSDQNTRMFRISLLTGFGLVIAFFVRKRHKRNV